MAESPTHFSTDPAELPFATRTELCDLTDGSDFELRISPVAVRLGDSVVRMLAYNGSVPGPTLRVRQGESVLVRAVNGGDLETTVHWHGLRIDNRYDGTTRTQQPIPIGGRFEYHLTFPDPGLYWYHPHVREDYGQEVGLSGSIIVVPTEQDYWPPVHREITVTLDDILIEEGRVAPFDRERSNYTAMGRYGNLLLVNGQVDPTLRARPGEVVRIGFTNTANARVFNLVLPDLTMKLIGGDSGRYEHESLVESIVIAPSERVLVDVLFDHTGRYTLEHRTPGRSRTLATIEVGGTPATPSLGDGFRVLRSSPELARERARLAPYQDAPPDRTLALVAEMDLGEPSVPEGGTVIYVCPMHPDVTSPAQGKCPKCGMKLLASTGAPPAGALSHEHGHGADHDKPDGGSHHQESREFAGIEWDDDMVEVNRTTTPSNTHWRLVDKETGKSGGEINWRFRVGDRVKIRLVNEMDSDHPMHHPFHVHGAGRFLVLSRDGVSEPNLVWKDTVLIRTGQTVDILFEVTNPGVWMAHCHIAEHHEGGMMLSFEVDPS